MRKILIFLMAIVTLAVTSPAFAAKRSIMELPPFERAVLIIKSFETMHKPKHWPYVGYGHQVQPNDPYRRGVQLTEPQADALLRKDLAKFIALFADLNPSDALLMGVLSYNIGPGAVKKSTVYHKLKSGDRDILKSYTSHCRYKGKFHRGLHTRRCQEFAALFVR